MKKKLENFENHYCTKKHLEEVTAKLEEALSFSDLNEIKKSIHVLEKSVQEVQYLSGGMKRQLSSLDQITVNINIEFQNEKKKNAQTLLQITWVKMSLFEVHFDPSNLQNGVVLLDFGRVNS